MSFIFGGNTGRTAADAKRMRQRAMLDQAAMARSRVRKPIDIIDPLAYMLAGKIRDNRASKIETEAREAQQAYMGKLINALLPGEGGGGGSYSGGGGGGSYSGASPSAGASAAPEPGMSPAMAAGSLATAAPATPIVKALAGKPEPKKPAAAPGATAAGAGITPSPAATQPLVPRPEDNSRGINAMQALGPAPSATVAGPKASSGPGPAAMTAPPAFGAPPADGMMPNPAARHSLVDGVSAAGGSIVDALQGAGRGVSDLKRGAANGISELLTGQPFLPATKAAPSVTAALSPQPTANNRDLSPGASGAPGAMANPARVGVAPPTMSAPRVVDALSGRTTQQDTPLPVKAAAPTATRGVASAATPPPAQPASNPNLPVRSNRPQYDLFGRHYQGDFMKRYSRADEDRIAANAISQKELKAQGIELSKYYTLNEISGNHGRAIIAAPRALRGLDMMTERFGEKLPIMSGFRTRKQVPHGSYRHNEGWAFDFNMRGWSDEKKRRLITAAREAGATSLGYGVGRKSSMLHIDWSPKTVDQVKSGGRGGSLWGYGGQPPGWVEKVWRNTKALTPGESPTPTGPDAIAQALGSGPAPATRSVGGAAPAAPSYGASPQGGRRRQLAELLLNAPPGAFDNMSRPQQMLIGALMQDALKGGGGPELIYRDLGGDIAVIDKRSGKLINRIPANAAGGGVGGAGGARGAGGPKLALQKQGNDIVAIDPYTGKPVNRITPPQATGGAQPRIGVDSRTGKPWTEGQRKIYRLFADADVAWRQLEQLEKEGFDIGDYWKSANVGDVIGDAGRSAEYQRYMGIVESLIQPLLRDETGAQINDSEEEMMRKRFLPRTTESAQSRREKRERLKAALEARRRSLGLLSAGDLSTNDLFNIAIGSGK